MMMNNIFRTFCLCSSILALTACGTATTSGTGTTRPVVDAADMPLQPSMAKAVREANNAPTMPERIAALDTLYQEHADNPAIALHYAVALREDEQLNRARLILTPFVQDESAQPALLTEMAMINLELGQNKEAEIMARRAVKTDPNNARAYLAMGTALDAQNNHVAAEEAFRAGLDHWQGDPAPILNNLALNLASQGHLDESINVLEKARKLSPRRMEIERNYRIISTLRESTPASSNSAPLNAPTPARKPAPEKLSQADDEESSSLIE